MSADPGTTLLITGALCQDRRRFNSGTRTPRGPHAGAVVLAALAVIGAIGFTFERRAFGAPERVTVFRWGMIRPASGISARKWPESGIIDLS
jgi:hypothetical protein